MGVGERSIYRWLKQATSPDGLAAKPHAGPAPRLTVQQQQELESLLRQGAKAHGWANELWTTQRIADLIQRHFGVSLHHDHVGRFLRQRLGWSPQKPKRRARERNEDAIKHWKSVTFPDIVYMSLYLALVAFSGENCRILIRVRDVYYTGNVAMALPRTPLKDS